LYLSQEDTKHGAARRALINALVCQPLGSLDLCCRRSLWRFGSARACSDVDHARCSCVHPSEFCGGRSMSGLHAIIAMTPSTWRTEMVSRCHEIAHSRCMAALHRVRPTRRSKIANLDRMIGADAQHRILDRNVRLRVGLHHRRDRRKELVHVLACQGAGFLWSPSWWQRPHRDR